MLYRWKEQIESQLEGKSLSVDEREELKRLRKENKNLRMEKEILNKASVDSMGHFNTSRIFSPGDKNFKVFRGL